MTSEILSKRLRFMVLGLALLAGCATTQENPATWGADVLYERATTAFEERDYSEATRLLEAFVQTYLADPRAPEARLMLGRAHMERNEYLTAATHFQRLVTDFPSSPLALTARLATCEAYREISPRPQLDQEYTRAAILHCQAVAEYYPGTPEAEQSQEYVDELRAKLARKVYENGMFYVRRNAFDAAIVYFQQVLDQFPETNVAPAALARMVEVYSQIGYVEEAEAARERLLQQYPQSEEARSVSA